MTYTRKLSVIMSVFNAEKFVGQSITSILNQTYSDFEFIIIDDGSTDSSSRIIKEYAQNDNRIRFHQNSNNIGITRSINYGLSLATGMYLARMDADDISLYDRFQKQIAYLDRHPNVGILSANCKVIDEFGNEIGISQYPRTDIEIRWHSILNNPFCNPCSMFRSKLAFHEKLNPSMEYCEDYEYWNRLLRLTEGANLDEVLLYYRRGKENVSTKYLIEQTEIATSVASSNLTALFGYDYFSKYEVSKLQHYSHHAIFPVDQDDQIIFLKWLKTYQIFKSKFSSFENKIELKKIRKSLARSITNLYLSNFHIIGFSSKLCLSLLFFSPIETIAISVRVLAKTLLKNMGLK